MPMTKNPSGKNDYKTDRSALANFRALEGEGNERKFEISFSSEQPVDRWYGKEILDHADGAVDLGRLQDMGVVLFGHRSDSVENVVGKIDKVWVEDNRGKAIIEFDDDEASQRVQKKVESGTLRGVSVGYVIDELDEIKAGAKSKDGRFAGPCYVASRWTPYEISIVPVPADASVGVGRSEGTDATPENDPLSVFEAELNYNESRAKALAANASASTT